MPEEEAQRGGAATCAIDPVGPRAQQPSGYVEHMTRRGASGWAWLPSSPDANVHVEAILGDRVVGRTVADLMRRDLRELNFGTGRHGFEMVFDTLISGSEAPLLHVVEQGQYTRLPGAHELPSPQPLETHGAPLEPPTTGTDPTLEVPATPRGYVEQLTRHGASGWAWLPSSPDLVVQVEAILDGRVIGRATADRMRADLRERRYGTGCHGFEIGFDEPIRGLNAPIVRVAGVAGSARLPGACDLTLPVATAVDAQKGSVMTHTAEAVAQRPAEPQGYVESVTRLDARGWAWSPSSPEAVLQIEAMLGGRVIGRAVADKMRPDLLKRNYGTGRYGFTMFFDEPATGDTAPDFRVLVPSPQCLPGVKTLPPPSLEDVLHRPPSTIATWCREHAQFTTQGPEFEEFDASILTHATVPPDRPKPLLLAFYLTQFHAIPENDQFWGKGFTEWRQIARGVSRFPGHYQPRIPRDLGFYELNNLNTFRVQADLAKAAGIHAFAFYYYWFNGKRVLEKPLDMLLASRVDMPFMILWSNENWTRTWDGSESEVLLRQDYRRQDEDALLKDLARHFLDDRYIRIAGRPLFVIYNPESIPEPASSIDRWRRILATRYGLEPLFFMAQTFGARDPRHYACDGAIEFPPHKTAEKLVGRLMPDAYTQGCRSQIIRYDDFVGASLNEEPPVYHLIKTAVPSWDNEARRPNRSLTLEHLSPAKYQAWLKRLILHAIEKPILGTPIVAINAWNEWAEAAYLEPDVYYGSSFLNATARAYVSALAQHASAQSDDINRGHGR
jgi:hypothetical protein